MKTRIYSLQILGFCALLLLLLPASVHSQGQSPLTVTGISFSPATFKPGDDVSVTITLRNPSTQRYGCTGMSAAIQVFHRQPYTVYHLIWRAEQATAPMAAGESRNVTFSQRFTVPRANHPQLFFNAWSPMCAPDEFGRASEFVVGQECVYTHIPHLPRPMRQIRPQ